MRQLTLAFILAFILAGCGGSPAPAKATEQKEAPHAHDHDADHDHDHDEDHHHHHDASRGGTLVELGDHVGNIEFVLDPETGDLNAYCSDAHAENPVRLKDDALSLSVVPSVGAAPIEVRLAAVANPLSGETVGDTSQFGTVVEALKGQSTFDATLAPLNYRGVQLEATQFTYKAGALK